jgi:hypothetical protein
MNEVRVEAIGRESDALATYLVEARGDHGDPGAASSARQAVEHSAESVAAVARLNRKYGAVPREPWAAVSPNLLWRGIANIPAGADLDDRQDRRPGVRAGRGMRLVRASRLKMAVDAISAATRPAVVVGMTDPPPHEMVISAFYNANVPLRGMRTSPVRSRD